MKFKKVLSKEARFALKYAQDHHDCIQWIALDAFRIWYVRPSEDGTSEFARIDFVIKEVE